MNVQELLALLSAITKPNAHLSKQIAKIAQMHADAKPFVQIQLAVLQAENQALKENLDKAQAKVESEASAIPPFTEAVHATPTTTADDALNRQIKSAVNLEGEENVNR